MIYNGHCRMSHFCAEVVAVPLKELFSQRTGRIKFKNRESLFTKFKIDASAKLMIVGIGRDRFLENYWSLGRSHDLPDAIMALSPAMVTAPNFSLFTDVPRWDNLHNMKRIAKCWHEIASNGIPTALHVNARTDRDWERWVEFLRFHEEIAGISYEFKTGAAIYERGKWHVDQLLKLAAAVGRPLDILIRGGQQYLGSLKTNFRQTSFLSSDVFVKTVKRRRLRESPDGKLRWARTWTMQGEFLDDLLADNFVQAQRVFELGKYAE